MKTFPISRSVSHFTFALRLAMVAPAGVSLGACSGGHEQAHGDSGSAGNEAGAGGSDVGGSGGGGNAAGNTGSGGSGASECETRQAEAIAIDKEFFHSGFRVTLGDALVTAVTAACENGKVVIDANFYNRGSTVSWFDTRILLTVGGHDYPVSDSESDFPDVEAERTASGTLVFNVDEDFAMDEATLLFGASSEQKAVVPVGPTSPDALVTLEPQELAITGPVDAGQFHFEVRSGLLRADVPWEHYTLDDQHLFLSVFFDATYVTSGLGGDNLLRRNFLLHLPDGSSLEPEDAPNELFNTAGSSMSDLFVTFEIPAPASGSYSIEFGGPWMVEGAGYMGGTLDFELEVGETLEPLRR